MKKAVLRAVFPGIFCVEAFGLFAVLYIAIAKDVLDGYLKWYTLVIGAVFILPSVILFLVARQAYSGRISGLKATVYTCVSAVVIGMLCLATLFWIGFYGDKHEHKHTSDPADYSEKYELSSVIFFLVARQAYLGRISGIKATVYTCVSAVVIGMLCLATLFWIGFSGNKHEHTSDPADYSEKYELSSAVNGIFPEEIPTNAENVIFDYCPPSWQGERHLMLMYGTDEDEISAVEETGDFMNLWEIDKEDRKKLRILLRSYFDIESTPNDKINAYVIDGTNSRDSTVIAVLTMPESGKIAYIYYID